MQYVTSPISTFPIAPFPNAMPELTGPSWPQRKQLHAENQQT
jgi:hypothetical protein